MRIRQAGSRPILLARRVDAPDIDRYPWLSVCWDLAFGEGEEEEMRRQVKEAIEGMERRRLAGVRIARLRDGRRDVPLEPQAALLERAWPELAPTTLVYDVDPPGASLLEVARALDEIRAFHLGEKRPPRTTQGGPVLGSRGARLKEATCGAGARPSAGGDGEPSSARAG